MEEKSSLVAKRQRKKSGGGESRGEKRKERFQMVALKGRLLGG